MISLFLAYVAPVTADILLDAVQSGGTGYQCGRVVGGNFELISAHTQERKAIAKCMTEHVKDMADGTLDADYYAVQPTGEIRIVVSSEAQTVINVGNCVPTPSGVVDSRYCPDGDDGTGSIPLTWATIPNSTNNIEGSTVTIDLDALYLTQPGSPDATCSNVGASFPTGWGLQGTNNCDLHYNGTGTGSAVIRIRASRSGVNSDSNAFTVESVASASSDTTAPTIITGVEVTMNGSDQPVITFDPPADVRVSGEDVSGLDTFTVSRGVTGLTPTSYTGTEFVPQYTQSDIGTVAATSAVQSGADWTLQGQGGAPIDGTNFNFLHTSVTGDFIATIKIESVTGGSAAARGAGLQARESTATGARQVHAQLFAASLNSRTYTRSVTDGAVVQDGLVTLTSLPGWLRLVRSGNVFSTYASDDGNNFGLVLEQTLGLSSTLLVGPTVQSDEAVTVTAEIENVTVQKLARQSFTDTGGTFEDSYTIVADDVAGNTNAASTAVVAPPDQPTGGSTQTPDYPDPMEGVTTLGGRTLTSVAVGQLATALSDQDCGETLQLANGTHSGSHTINANCPANNPFIVECLNDHACTLSGSITMGGARNILRFVRFTGSSISCGGTNNKILANEVTSWSGSVGISPAKNGQQCEIAYNEMWEPDPPSKNRYSIRTSDDGASDFHYNGWIHYNYLHDLPDKPVPSNYSSGQTDAIEICETFTSSYAGIVSGWYVEHNLIEDHLQGSGTGAASVDIKCGGTVLRRNTFRRMNGRVDQRHGTESSIFEANFLDDTKGMNYQGDGHGIYGNRITNGGDFELISGSSTGNDCGVVGTGQMTTCNAHIAGNIGPFLIGRTYSGTCGANPPYRVRDILFENHTGQVTFGCYESGSFTDNRNGPSTYNHDDADDWILNPADVGPSQITSAPAAYRAARDL